MSFPIGKATNHGKSDQMTIDRCKEEVHDQTLVGKKADSAVFGVSITRAVRALALVRTTF